ncbi:MAG: Holliday junction branch migration protein RuvA [Proteobacteria bacterium]|nr:Holliday junction branch migration protein RuvA [Pseudomonadota bacterium]
MIGHLRGEILHVAADHLIIDVGGVGYLVHPTGSVLHHTAAGQTASLWIEMDVKQDQISLFGFANLEEKRWFKTLQIVQGVGAKLAIAILSLLAPEALTTAIVSGDKNMLQMVPGVGSKLATRLVTELKDKAATYAQQYSISLANQNQKNLDNKVMPKEITIFNDAVSALANFGFHKNDIEIALRTIIDKENVLDLQELIRMGLQTLGRDVRAGN